MAKVVKLENLEFEIKKAAKEMTEQFWWNVQPQIFALGRETERTMKLFIQKDTKRGGSTGNLASNIHFVPDMDTSAHIQWGVGEIDVLMANAPYYYVVNSGKKITGGAFAPYNGKAILGDFEGERPDKGEVGKGTQHWNKLGKRGKGFFMAPGVIRPMNYIENTWEYVLTKLNEIVDGWSYK